MSEVPQQQQQQHAADQAGGEIVFSSDGLDPLPAPTKPPRILQQQKEYDTAVSKDKDDDDDGVQEDTVPAERAFEMFAGKLYPPSSSSTSTRLRLHETPLQRLGRLQDELQAIKQELSVTTAADDSAEPQIDPVAAASLQQTLQQLQQQLETTTTRLLPHNRQQALSQQIAASVEGFTEQKTPAAGRMTAAEIDDTLEQRLARLEVAVGSSSSTTTTSTQPLLQRLVQLEEVSAKLDASQADLWQRRAKTIRQDLEAAAKARNKLMSTTGTGSVATATDTKTIAELYNTSQQLQGLIGHLPALVQRLQALSAVHQEAATWSVRLKAAEEMASQLERNLLAVQESLQTLQAAVTENAKTLQENLQALE